MNNIQGLNDLNVTLGQMLNRASNPLPAYNEIAVLLSSAIQQHFYEGGRPERWKVSRRAKREGGQTLLRTGRLMRSESRPQVSQTGIVFGSNLPHAAIHQFGGEINMPARSELFTRNRTKQGENKGRFRPGTKVGRGVTRKAYTINMPARPSIVFLPADTAQSGRILFGHLLGRA